MAAAWSKHEVDLAIADYMAMLSEELRGKAYNKTEHRNVLLPLLNNRSHGSVERKHQNISAVLISFGYPYISGYKPLMNYQALLHERVAAYLTENYGFSDLVCTSVDRLAEKPTVTDYLNRIVQPPTKEDWVYSSGRDIGHISRRPVRINYLERESRNISLGLAGEQFVVEFERARLTQSGYANLASRIEHVSVSQGDGLGFDIRSFEDNGKDRLIEVKTTAGGIQTPFFVSRDELQVSQEREDSYHLYRVFAFREDPRLFSVCGALDKVCRLEASRYSARIA